MSMRPSKRLVWIDSASRISLCCIVSGLCSVFCQCTQNYGQREAERYIIESERQWAESVASGDTAVIQRILADDFVGVDPKGRH